MADYIPGVAIALMGLSPASAPLTLTVHAWIIFWRNQIRATMRLRGVVASVTTNGIRGYSCVQRPNLRLRVAAG